MPRTLLELTQAVQALEEQAQRTHKLLEQHMQEESAERKVRHLRYEGIMSLLGQILEKLPELPR